VDFGGGCFSVSEEKPRGGRRSKATGRSRYASLEQNGTGLEGLGHPARGETL